MMIQSRTSTSTTESSSNPSTSPSRPSSRLLSSSSLQFSSSSVLSLSNRNSINAWSSSLSSTSVTASASSKQIRIDISGAVGSIRKQETKSLRDALLLTAASQVGSDRGSSGHGCNDNGGAAEIVFFPTLCIVRGVQGSGKSSLISNVYQDLLSERPLQSVNSQRVAVLASTIEIPSKNVVVQSPHDLIGSWLLQVLQEKLKSDQSKDRLLNAYQDTIQNSLSPRERGVLKLLLQLGSRKMKVEGSPSSSTIVDDLFLNPQQGSHLSQQQEEGKKRRSTCSTTTTTTRSSGSSSTNFVAVNDDNLFDQNNHTGTANSWTQVKTVTRFFVRMIVGCVSTSVFASPGSAYTTTNKDEQKPLLRDKQGEIDHDAAPSTKLNLFVDDIQYADSRILEVLQFLLTDEELATKLSCCVTYEIDESNINNAEEEEEGAKPLLTGRSRTPRESETDREIAVNDWVDTIQNVQSTKFDVMSSAVSSGCDEDDENDLAEDTKQQFKAQTITLDALTEEQSKGLLSRSMKRENDGGDDVVHTLAEILYQRSHGNLFDIQTILDYWQDNGWICYNFDSYRWDVQNMEQLQRLTPLSDSVANVLRARIETVHREELYALQVVSLFGHSTSIDRRDLDLIVSNSKIIFENNPWESMTGGWLLDGLQQACESCMLISVSHKTYRFPHKRVQEAVYQLMLNDKESDYKETLHSRIGMVMLDSLSCTDPYLSNNEDADRRCVCADQFVIGLSKAKSPEISDDTRSRIAHLFRSAGLIASRNGAFEISCRYLKYGIEVLEGIIQNDHDLLMDLYSLCVEMEVRCGRTEEAHDEVSTLFKLTNNREDKIRASRLLLRCYHAENDFENMVSATLDLLAAVGEETFPKKPSLRYIRRETQKTLKLLESKPRTKDSDFLDDIPKMGERKRVVMSILNELLAPSVLLPQRHSIYIIAASRMARLTLEYGLCEFSGAALSSFAFSLIGYFERPKEALDLAETSVNVINKIPSSVSAGTCLMYCGVILTTEPSRKSHAVIKQGFELSFEGGDVSAAFLSLAFYFIGVFYDGAPLEALLAEVEKLTPQMLDFNQRPYLLYSVPVWQSILSLTGKASDQNGVCSNKIASSSELFRDHLLTFQMQEAFYFGDTHKAFELKNQIDDEPGKLIQRHCPFAQVRLLFYIVINVETYRNTKKRRYLKEAKTILNTLESLVKKGFIKLLHKYQIAKAEVNSVNKRADPQVIVREYQTAVVSSAKSSYLQDAALANYLCGKFCSQNDELKNDADLYFQKASQMFTDWGGYEVARSIQRRYPGSFL
eukprot:CAMPEP_0113478140 /NCGR_PEP_ID=MMETSP0014_2-20120614/20587_1 /TAXON_ID=2857 /ORGANISM="Nitzschia sp." /LENGTH=1290 /DNA_ID=CAMNT_0000371291 /DNA_START=193 /DNA_END=4062 /DNA_ORIENTATION=- /assembly_acc=CAM_ASM_000159